MAPEIRNLLVLNRDPTWKQIKHMKILDRIRQRSSSKIKLLLRNCADRLTEEKRGTICHPSQVSLFEE